MSETTGVLAGTVATAALNSAIRYMTPGRRAHLARVARNAARRRPGMVAILAAVASFLAIRTIRVAVSGGRDHPAPRASEGGGHGAR